MENNADLLKELCCLLIADKRDEAYFFANKHLPFKAADNIGIKDYEKLVVTAPNSYAEVRNTGNGTVNGSRRYSKSTIFEVFIRDGFLDRFTGCKLLNPGVLMCLHFELPDIFRYHGGWKLGACHTAFWEFYPTVDHIVPITKSGSDEIENLLTISMIGNARKSNTLLSKLGWQIRPHGNVKEWDGLTMEFLKLMEKNNNYSEFKHIPNWSTQIQKLKQWLTVSRRALKVNTTPDNDSTNYLLPVQTESFLKVNAPPVIRNNGENEIALSDHLILFKDLPVGSLFSYGKAKTIYRKLSPLGSAVGRVINLCRPNSDNQREWALLKQTELDRIVRPVEETQEIRAKLYL